MKSNKVVCINGESWVRNLTGIERLAIEATCFLDRMVPKGTVRLVVPKNAKNLPSLKNIEIVTLNAEAHFMPAWTQIHFQKYVLSHNGISLNFSNTCPFLCPGFEFIHDIYCALYPEDLKTRRDKLIYFYSTMMYKRIARKAKAIFTVSEYTKKTIVEKYGTPADKIHVVYSGVSGYKNIVADNTIFDKLPVLKDMDFYFTLGSLSVRKNLKWIVRHAELYPNELFAVSGKPLPTAVSPELKKLNSLPNIIMTGYLSDGEVKALLKKAKAFVLPTYFEGFGLPPLEALSAGCTIIVSNKTSLPEIYGKCAHYIDPDEPNVNLDVLLKEDVESPEKILEKYTLENTAKRMLEVMKRFDVFGNLQK